MATEVLEELQVTPLIVASEGLTVAVNESVFPTKRFNDTLSRETLETGIVSVGTVTVQVAV